MSAWSLVYEGVDAPQEGLREALCTLGNGYFATRGAAAEAAADDVHYPGTYLAGGYDRRRTEVAGRVIENEDLVNLPNWLPLTFRIDGGPWLAPGEVEVLELRQELDLRRALLRRTLRVRDAAGRTTRLEERRLVSMARQHVAAQELTITAEDWSGTLEVRAALEGRVENAGVARYRELNGDHLEPVASDAAGDALFLEVRTRQSHLHVAQAARTRALRVVGGAAAEVEGSWTTRAERAYASHQLALEVSRGDAVRVEKVLALFTSRDHAISEPGLAARELAGRPFTFAALLDEHALAWEHLWRRFDMELTSRRDGRSLLILRLHLLHLLQVTSPHVRDLDVGVPARGLHGEAYRGHIFWDELFIFPLLNLRRPEITRALLLYRYRRLGEARALARRAGYRGALFPWQSGSDGREESQVYHLNPRSGRWHPDNTHLQRHVTAAIAYNVWHYHEASGDHEFLSDFGGEMILEIARFWADIAVWNPELERYEIKGVMGPDEYHDAYPGASSPGLDNNAYTNVMAVWVLCRGLDTLELLPSEHRREVSERIGLTDEEVARWERVSRRMRVCFHDGDIISQFEGYERLEEFDWEGYRARYGDIQRLDRILEAEGDTPNRYQLSKQADVLMLFYLFTAEELAALFERLGYEDEWQPSAIPRTVDYYTRRTSHGSTLSRVVHSWVLARSDRERSYRLFAQALESDVGDVQGGTTPEGIHLGAMAGTVDLVQRGWTGIDTLGGVLWLNPCLPDELERLELRIEYRGHPIGLECDHERLRVEVLPGARGAIKVGYLGEVRELAPGEALELPCARDGDPPAERERTGNDDSE